jgi:aminoglycoside 2'-N-acetyltransferase I
MVAMTEVASVHTDDITPSDIAAIGALLDAAFGGRFDEHDWEHATGGRHAIVRQSGAIVAHGAVVPRTLWVGGDEHIVGYVEAVAAEPGVQGRGLGSTVMRALADEIEARYRIGVLSTGEWGFYERLGWQRWRGVASVRLATGAVVRTPDEDDGIMALVTTGELDLAATFTGAERAGDDW